MGFFDRLFGHKQNVPVPSPVTPPAVPDRPAVYNPPIPNSLSLGWYYNETSKQLEMVRIPLDDRAVHLYTVGASGAGKTKFLEFQIDQDITLGNGFCVIDPHGDLIDETLGFLACYYHKTQDESIFDRVIVVDPTDPVYTVGFNVLEVPPGVAPIEQAQELIMVFKRIWASAWGPRMEELMRNALISLSLAGLTLGHLSEFLTSQPFRTQVMEKVAHPIARPYFERFDTMTRAAQLQWTEPVTNKVNAFLSDERISQMLSVPNITFTLRDVMDQQMILLIKLNKGKLRESADLLGSLFTAKLQLAAFSRTDIPEGQRVPFYLYIDEFQNFASESFSVVLSEARKYGLRLVLAHQTLEQIPPDLRGIILGNTGIQVYFRINRKDAELLAKEAFTYSGYNVKTVQMSGSAMQMRYWSLGEEWERNFALLQRLPPRHCIVTHKIAGGMLPVETVSIDPVWKTLGMTQEEYTAYLSHLPFGHKYLIARATLTRHPTAQPTPAQPPRARGQAEERLANAAVPYERKPEIDEQQRVFLEYIIANPDTPMTTVYRGIGVSVWIGSRIRDELKDKGLLAEIETRLGTAGRRSIFFIPTFPAFELLGKEPPSGRGGVIHRHIQQLIEIGAAANGFLAQSEYALDNGGIVDVHLEKGDYRVAVEIAVASRPSREIVHIQLCLAAGYEKIFVVFADEHMAQKTQEALQSTVTAEEREKVQLLHLSKLSGLIYSIVAVVGGRVNLPAELTQGE